MAINLNPLIYLRTILINPILLLMFLIQTNRFLKNNSINIVTRADNGNVPVLMTKLQYNNIAMDILNDNIYYKKNCRSFTSTIEQRATIIIYKLLIKKTLSIEDSKHLLEHTSITLMFYGVF